MNQPIRYETLNQAAIWFSVLQSDDATAEDHQQWERWLSQDTSHVEAWHQVETISGSISPLRHHNGQMGSAISNQLIHANQVANRLHPTSTLNRRTLLKGLIAAPILGCLWKAHDTGLINEWTLPYRADLSNESHIAINKQLSDGTYITLAIKSGISIAHSPHKNDITLLAGDIAIQQSTGSKPIQISLPDAVITAQQSHIVIRQSAFHNTTGASDSLALGITHKECESAHIAVFKGTPLVVLKSADQTLRLAAGQKTHVSSAGFGPVLPAAKADLAWTHNMLQATSLQLDQWASIINQHHSSYLSCHPSIKKLIVMGSFPLDNTPLALSMLQNALPVRTRQITSLWTLIEPA